jgi:hypothetical protein
MEAIEIIFVVATLIAGPYLVWDAYRDRKGA